MLVLLEMESPLDGGLGGSGLQPAGSDDSDSGREDDSAIDVGLEDAGGVGGIVWTEERLFVLSLRRSSKMRRSPRNRECDSAAGPTTVAEEALVEAETPEATDTTSDTGTSIPLDRAELEDVVFGLWCQGGMGWADVVACKQRRYRGYGPCATPALPYVT